MNYTDNAFLSINDEAELYSYLDPDEGEDDFSGININKVFANASYSLVKNKMMRMEMRLRVNDGKCWTEAALFADTEEVCCENAKEHVLGKWSITYDGDTYIAYVCICDKPGVSTIYGERLEPSFATMKHIYDAKEYEKTLNEASKRILAHFKEEIKRNGKNGFSRLFEDTYGLPFYDEIIYGATEGNKLLGNVANYFVCNRSNDCPNDETWNAAIEDALRKCVNGEALECAVNYGKSKFDADSEKKIYDAVKKAYSRCEARDQLLRFAGCSLTDDDHKIYAAEKQFTQTYKIDLFGEIYDDDDSVFLARVIKEYNKTLFKTNKSINEQWEEAIKAVLKKPKTVR